MGHGAEAPRAVHLLSAKAERAESAVERSWIFFAVTDQDGRLIAAERCSGNIGECSQRVVEVALASCQ
jgi:hypothetical protein